ncbi:MAG TPA: methionine ABC transporter permease, partial [Lachnoclostridium sp.]|nr:methionine ABC transporter permease [Lachnoclostridium sp.]
MIEQYLGITSEQMIIAAGQTVYMLFWGLVLGSFLGIPLGILLTITRKGGILQNKVVYALINYTINIVRSVPYIILLVAIMPLTKIIVGTRIGT